MIRQFNQCNSATRKKEFEIIYNIVENNQNLTVEQLVEKISSSLKEDCTLHDIERFLNFIVRFHYPTRGTFVIEVLNSRKNGDTRILEAPSVRKIECMDEIMSETSPLVEQERARLASEMMKSYLEAKKEGKDVERPSNDYYKIKKDLCRLDFDLVVDYYIAVNNLVPISVEELDQIKFTLEFFIEHLSKNYEMFEKLDYTIPEDIERIKDFYIEGERTLAPLYKNNIGKLYAWKLGKLREALNNYKMLSDNLKNITEKHEFGKLETISFNRKNNINSESPFLVEYYDQINSIGRVYDGQIKKVHTITDDKRKELEKLFVKKLLLQNNSVENK